MFLAESERLVILIILPAVLAVGIFLEEKMKKFFAIILAALLIISCSACGNKKVQGPTVTVSIFAEGEAKLGQGIVELIDYDNDGKYTLDEAIKAAHAQFAPNKENDYASADLGFGLTITKLWGDESMSYSYFINNEMAWSALDEVKENDYICAFVYKDAAGFSDKYAWFDDVVVNGKEVQFTVKYLYFDENFNTVSATLAGGKVLDNSSETFITDSEGKLTISNLSKGTHTFTLLDDTDNNNIFNGAIAVININ